MAKPDITNWHLQLQPKLCAHYVRYVKWYIALSELFLSRLPFTSINTLIHD